MGAAFGAAAISRVGVHPAVTEEASNLGDHIGQSSFQSENIGSGTYDVAVHFVLYVQDMPLSATGSTLHLFHTTRDRSATT